MIDIDLNGIPELVATLANLREQLGPQALHEAATRGVAEVVREHLRNLDTTRPNKLGGGRQNFYGKAAQSIAEEATPEGGTVSITHQGFALRFYGGVVKPVKAKALAVPAMAAAYGLGPREPEVPKLHARYFRARKAVGGLFDDQGAVWYWLLPETRHAPDPSVLPDEAALSAAAAAAIEDLAAALLDNISDPPPGP